MILKLIKKKMKKGNKENINKFYRDSGLFFLKKSSKCYLWVYKAVPSKMVQVVQISMD